MFNAKAFLVKSQMVVGKSLTLIIISALLVLYSTSAKSSDLWNPQFFSYKSNNVVQKLVDVSFGWFKKLNDEQKAAHAQSITHALEFAENGKKVTWYKDNASGYAVPVITWPANGGYCRRLHISVIAYNVHKVMTTTACHNSSSNLWTWYKDK
tara:strand:+ start:255 stop:713 length:459 start_codon:yes stop_codon:yes gene_type:complete